MASLVAIMLESIPSLLAQHRQIFRYLEWFFTIIFTVEYIIRLIIVVKPSRDAMSFYGIIDLISILPTYLAVFLLGAQYFSVIRSFRLLQSIQGVKDGSLFRGGPLA
ncbi:MAG: ion transporter [Owenweeksia sp.]|nr:ion transporter [Owenweeksia sp.]